MQWMPAARAELSIQEQGSAVQRAGASAKGSERTHGQDRLDQSMRAVPVRSSPLLFGCAGVRDPSTRARRMRHRDRRQRKHSKHSRGGGKGTAVKVQGC